MEEWKHVCKLCGKSFPCGRSLGGHMRSHGSSSANSSLPSASGYGLREKRKKPWRLVLSDSTHDLIPHASKPNHNHNNLCNCNCKACGKGFHSWKALFGHMKCHSAKQRETQTPSSSSSSSHQDQPSWTPTQSLNPRKRTRSKRSRIDQQQHEVALSLIMLSRGSPQPPKSNPFFHIFTSHSLVEGKRDFECTACNKIFPSYQALGGHRASHKKMKIPFAPVIDDTSDNSEKPDFSHQQTISASDNNVSSLLADETREAETSRDFIEEPVHKIRGLFDLNLPADDVEDEREDSNNHSNSECYRSSPCSWVRSTPKKQELLVGLLSS